MTENKLPPLARGKANPKDKGKAAAERAVKKITEEKAKEEATGEIPPLPDYLDRKLNPQTPATLEEREAFAAMSKPPVEATSTPDHVLAEIEQVEAQRKKAKASNRLGRLADQKAVRDIPEKFRAWDPDRSVWFDVRKGKPKEGIMTALQTASKTKTPVTTKKATPKATPKKVAKKRDGKGRSAIIGDLAVRKNGVTRPEMIEATGWDNAGFNTMLKGEAKRRGLKLVIDKKAKPFRYMLTK